MKTRRKINESLYVDIYQNPEWPYKQDPTAALGSQTASGAPALPAAQAQPESRGLPDLAPGQKVKLEHKSFVPVKEHDSSLAKPYGDVLDAPLN